MTQTPGNWYAVIDCARDERLMALVQACREHVCLLMGELSPALQAASPWLVKIHETDPLMGIWQTHGRGDHWGIMCETGMSLADLRRHFRRFLQAKLPDGTIALFRFYDPRVFNTYIRAALPEERAPWFNGVQQYAVEDADNGQLHQYQLTEGRLRDGAMIIG